MATIREYVEGKLARSSYELSSIELDALLSKYLADDQTLFDATTEVIAKQMLVDAIPELLLLPDVTEGGMSIKRDRAAITSYYGLLCSQLGIVNRLDAPAPTATDRSMLW